MVEDHAGTKGKGWRADAVDLDVHARQRLQRWDKGRSRALCSWWWWMDRLGS